jgi:hypothetical protein
MVAESRPRRRPSGLIGRRAECEVLDRLLAAVQAGESQVLVVHGEPGMGKTALLDYLARQAYGCRVLRVAGVQSEMELAFAGLHQLCAPLLGRLEVLPDPQREALTTAFGMSAGPAPERARHLVDDLLSLILERSGLSAGQGLRYVKRDS